MQGKKLQERAWWNYIGQDLQNLFLDSEFLYTMATQQKATFTDHSFVVFSAAKAYEGVLKKVFYEKGFITKKEYLGKRFRIGKSLSPSLSQKYRKEGWVYGELVEYCGSQLPNHLWETWKLSRNRLFHWFPGENNKINLEESRARVDRILNALDELFDSCSVQ